MNPIDLKNILSGLSFELNNKIEMLEIIDGPYNQPTQNELDSGSFVSEYNSMLSVFQLELCKYKPFIDHVGFLGESDGSRCFPVYLGDNFRVVPGLINSSLSVLEIIHSKGLEYCVSLALDWRSPKETSYMYIGIEHKRRRYCEWSRRKK